MSEEESKSNPISLEELGVRLSMISSMDENPALKVYQPYDKEQLPSEVQNLLEAITHKLARVYTTNGLIVHDILPKEELVYALNTSARMPSGGAVDYATIAHLAQYQLLKLIYPGHKPYRVTTNFTDRAGIEEYQRNNKLPTAVFKDHSQNQAFALWFMNPI